jgi:hypothetical protein
MALAELDAAAGEATATVAVVKCPAERGRDRARPGSDLDSPPVRIVPHDYAARVARQAARRFRGNVRAVVEDGLAGRVGIRQHGGV